MQESTLLDHVSLGVANLERSRAFYDATLRPLGLVRLLDFEGRGSDYGSVPHPHGVEFTITAESGTGTRAAPISASERPIEPLCAPSMPPRSRLAGWTMARPGWYHSSYYAAFVLDPDGHRVEAVCHAPDAVDRPDLD